MDAPGELRPNLWGNWIRNASKGTSVIGQIQEMANVVPLIWPQQSLNEIGAEAKAKNYTSGVSGRRAGLVGSQIFVKMSDDTIIRSEWI